ncbi:hypothetical protein MMR14E_28820 [Methylobacterium mesophilicum]
MTDFPAFLCASTRSLSVKKRRGTDIGTRIDLNVDFGRLLTHLEVGDQPASHSTDDRTGFPATEFQQLCAMLTQ